MLRHSIFVILTLMSFTAFSQAYLQKEIEFKEKELSVISIIQRLELQTNIQFSYSSSNLEIDQIIYLPRSTYKINVLLNKVLPNYGISNSIKGNDKILLFSTFIGETKEQFYFGKVIDEETNEPISNAIILIGSIVEYTDENGYFSLKIESTKAKKREIICLSLGYQPRNYNINANQRFSVFNLRHDNAFDTILIYPAKAESFFTATSPDGPIFNPESIFNSSSITGEPDLINAVKMSPQVQSGGEGAHGLLIRGGSADQNLILVDGVPLYEFSHLGGISSIFVSDVIQNAKLSVGAISAKYGGKLSSVLDINLKEGNKNRWAGKVGLGIDGMNMTIQGPILKEKTSIILSGRLSTFNLITQPLINNLLGYENNSLGYYDTYGKITHYFTPLQKISITGYTGKDQILLDSKNEFTVNEVNQLEQSRNELGWGNTLLGVNYSAVLSEKLNIDVFANYSGYTFNTRKSYSNKIVNEPSNVFEYDYLTRSLNQDFTSKINVKYYNDFLGNWESGVEYKKHFNAPTIRQSDAFLGVVENTAIDSVFESNSFAVYSEFRNRITSSIELKAGLRYNTTFGDNYFYGNLEPRLLLAYTTTNLRIFGTASINHQNLHLLLNPGTGLPSDLWYPSNELVAPEEAIEFSLSTVFKLNDAQKIQMNIFTKTLSNLIEYENSSDLFYNIINNEPSGIQVGNIDVEDNIVFGTGSANGFELAFEQKSEKLRFWINYKFGFSNRQFDKIFNGTTFPFKYDRRHDLNIGLNFNLKKGRSIQANWVFGSGYAYTLADSEYQVINGTDTTFVRVATGRNNRRLPSFHHLDIQYQQHFKWKKGKFLFSTGLYNLYNRKNPFYAYLKRDLFENKETLNIISLFPIIPNVNINYFW